MRVGIAYVISRERSIAFCQGSLAYVVASEFFNALGSGQCRECLTRINLSGWRDGFDARGAADVRAGVTLLSGHRINAGVNRPGMKRDAQIDRLGKSLLAPIGSDHKLAQVQREQTRIAHIREYEIETIAPCVLDRRRVRRS